MMPLINTQNYDILDHKDVTYSKKEESILRVCHLITNVVGSPQIRSVNRKSENLHAFNNLSDLLSFRKCGTLRICDLWTFRETLIVHLFSLTGINKKFKIWKK
jgi:hypothetical protein